MPLQLSATIQMSGLGNGIERTLQYTVNSEGDSDSMKELRMVPWQVMPVIYLQVITRKSLQ